MGDMADEHLERLYGLWEGDFFYSDLTGKRNFNRSPVEAAEAAQEDFWDEPIPKEFANE